MKRLLVTLACACTTHPPTAPTLTARDVVTTEATVVRVDTGLVRGVRHDSGMSWKGIPYAAPPIGELRWKPPAPAQAWSGVRDAAGFGNACMQSGSPPEPTSTAMGSEDCLTLNVWRPARASGSGAYPVMVFVHGGYFTWGSSSYRRFGTDLYDGAHLADAAGVIVVTLNYRVGPFGFLAIDEARREDAHASTGNYGLLDQLAALAWVKRNIAAFAGDPERVTLFGQSAGAISTTALYASPLSVGMFQRAIVHSGNGEAVGLTRALEGGRQLKMQLGCDGAPEALACMRAKSATQIATLMPETFTRTGYKYGPVVDGYVLAERPLQVIEHGRGMRVPIIVSTTSNEFSTMASTVLSHPLRDADDYQRAVEDAFGPALTARILTRYPASDFPTPLAAYIAVRSDAGFVCESDWIASAASRAVPAYRFVYDHTMSTGPLAPAGAGHGLDMYLVFQNTPARYLTLDDHERALAKEIVSYWSRFAATGDPNGAGAPTWGSRTAHGGEQLAVDNQIHMTTPSQTARCELWSPFVHNRS